MKIQMVSRKVASSVAAVVLLAGAAGISATAVAQPRASAGAGQAAAAATNAADAEFVRMMIPHHFQAVVMSGIAPTRSSHQAVEALASRIDVEQSLEIMMMQSWQGWNGLEVTDAEQAYQQVLQDPMMLEMMGMATPEELDDLRASSGTDFDVLYLELMIEHHEGALDMLIDVIINGNDFILEDWATGMLTTQYTQVLQMEAMLADLE